MHYAYCYATEEPWIVDSHGARVCADEEACQERQHRQAEPLGAKIVNADTKRQAIKKKAGGKKDDKRIPGPGFIDDTNYFRAKKRQKKNRLKKGRPR